MHILLKYQLIILVTFFTSSFSVAIDHVAQLKRAQNWANSFGKEYPILLMNRDEFHFLFLQNNVMGETQEEEVKRIQIITNSVLEKTGVQLSYSEASNFETYLFTLTGSAVALPFFEGFGNNSKHKICAVFANAPNGNSRIETERLTGIENKEAYKNKKYDQLTIKEDFEVLYLFSLYHEVSHCLDEVYLPEVYKSYQPSPQDIHLSESFAETLAYLHLSREIDFKIARARILYRTIYSRIVGEYFAKNPEVVFGDENILAGGAIYYLTPVLLEAYTLVSTRVIKPSQMSNFEIYEVAEKIVAEKAIHFRSFTAIVRSLKDKEEIIAEYEQLAFKSPELFLKSFSDLISYYTMTDLWVTNAFDEALESVIDEGDKSLEIPIDRLCEEVKRNELSSFLEVLNNYRESLKGKLGSFESRKRRYIELNSLSKTLSSSCHFSRN